MEVRDRFWINRYGPSHRRAQNASAALRVFVRHPKPTFATISPRERTSTGYLGNPAHPRYCALISDYRPPKPATTSRWTTCLRPDAVTCPVKRLERHRFE